MAIWMSISSATDSDASMAAGVVPQSSWSLRPMAPAATCSRSGSGLEALPFPRKPRLMGKPSAASSIRCMFQAPAVHVVALVPVAGPVPPPMSVVDPAGRDDAALAGYDLGGGAHDQSLGHSRLDVGVPRLAHTHDAAPADAEIRLDDAPVVQDEGLGDDEVEHAVGGGGPRGLAHPVANHLAPAELHLVAVDGEVLLDLDQDVGVGEPHAIADRGTVEIRVLAARQPETHGLTLSESRPGRLS